MTWPLLRTEKDTRLRSILAPEELARQSSFKWFEQSRAKAIIEGEAAHQPPEDQAIRLRRRVRMEPLIAVRPPQETTSGLDSQRLRRAPEGAHRPWIAATGAHEDPGKPTLSSGPAHGGLQTGRSEVVGRTGRFSAAGHQPSTGDSRPAHR